MAEDKSTSPAPEDAEIPSEHYQALGMAADAWAGLELCIDYLIWELMSVDQPIGACITAQFISIHPRLRALQALARLRGANKTADELDTFYGQVSGLAEKRNRLLHDKRLVHFQTKEVSVFHIATKKDLKFGLQREIPQDLLNFRKTVRRKMKEFDELSERIRHEIATSPKIPLGDIERLDRLPTHIPEVSVHKGPKR